MSNLKTALKSFAPFKYFCSQKAKVLRICIFLFLNVASALNVVFTAFCTFCLCPVSDKKFFPIIPAGVLYDREKIKRLPGVESFSLFQTVLLILIAICLLLIVFNVIRILLSFSKDSSILRFSTISVIISTVWVFAYTGICFLFSPINALLGGLSYSNVNIAPLIIAVVIALVHFFLFGILWEHKKEEDDNLSLTDRRIKEQRKTWRRSLLLNQLELLAFSVATAVVAIIPLLSNILLVTFKKPYEYIPKISLNGLDLILGKTALETKEERTIAFLVFLLLFITLASLFVSIISLCGRSSLANKLTLFSIMASSVSCVLVGLFGQYYKIVQTLNKSLVNAILDTHRLPANEPLAYTVSSSSLIYVFVLLGILAVLLIRHPFTKAQEFSRKLFEMDATILAPAAEIHFSGDATSEAAPERHEKNILAPEPDEKNILAPEPEKAEDFDPCPAFTELDSTCEEYDAELRARRAVTFSDPSLPSVVDFIVQYARDSRLHLFYTHETVAAFLAGLGATKLTILQGMSGTGKTSLPKIVAEALSSTCDIVEVESSWRDKNELLGYYNEFSKLYTPKKFTQALYKAALNPEVLTFIILDEMNLSRIEYYFSDFLSLMENEEHMRHIKLLNVPICRESNGESLPYKALHNGHTIKIPSNVWFIGTANRDESTYDISDKVYDRAHTLNFDKRAKKPLYSGEAIPARYLSPSVLEHLFEDAKTSVAFSVDGDPLVEKVDALLSPYNISFGNRVATQIEAFVKIYAACFPTNEHAIHDALDTILLSKVVKKLELKSIDDKDHLVSEFEKLGLQKCTEFIASLKED